MRGSTSPENGVAALGSGVTVAGYVRVSTEEQGISGAGHWFPSSVRQIGI